MPFALSDTAAAAGYRLEAYETIGSTSTEAAAKGRAGDPGPLWIVSQHQSAGRGRRGNPWATPPGNLAASLLMSLDVAPAAAATLGFVAGLALGRALDRCCGPRGLGRDGGGVRSGRFVLKWPNDVLVEGAKLAGILLETEQRTDGGRFLVIGIGVNVAHVPQGLPYAATSLATLGFALSAEAVFEALSAEWVDLLALWDRGRNFAEIRRLWLQRAAGLGGDIVVRSGVGAVQGVFETLDDGGELVIRLPDGSRRRVTAGDVHFGMAATVRSGAVG